MPTIHVTNRNGENYVIDTASGQSLMEALQERGDVEALCGGNCACATCHVHIDDAWCERVGAPTEDELALLEYSMERRPNSRLSCQIRIVDALDGLRLSIARAEG